MPISDYLDLTHDLAQIGDDPLGTLRLGLTYDPRYSGLVGYLSMNQATLRDALNCLCRNAAFIMRGGGFELDTCERVATLRYVLDVPAARARPDVEMTLAALLTLIRRLAPKAQVQLVSFTHEATCGKMAYRQLLRSPVAFHQDTNAVVFDAPALDTPIGGADPELRRSLEHLLSLAGLEINGDELLSRARAEIAKGLGDRSFGVDAVAKALCMTPRTLQRQLTLHQQTFSGLRDQVRRDRACAMLSHTDLPIGEVSFRLGFTEVSSFYRSFRQWTGEAPGAFRKRIVSETAKGKQPCAAQEQQTV